MLTGLNGRRGGNLCGGGEANHLSCSSETFDDTSRFAKQAVTIMDVKKIILSYATFNSGFRCRHKPFSSDLIREKCVMLFTVCLDSIHWRYCNEFEWFLLTEL